MRRWIASAVAAVIIATLIFPGTTLADSFGRRKIVKKVMPVYPVLARQIQATGTVRLRATVSPNGSVKSLKLLGGAPLFEQSATNAVTEWKWEAAPQETKEEIEINFKPN